MQYALTSTTSGFTVVGETVEKRDVKLSSERGRSPGTPREKGSPGLFADGKKRERLSVYGRAPRCYQIHRSNVFSFHHSRTGEGIFLGSFLASPTFGHNNRRMLEEWQEIFGGVIFAYSLFGPPCRNCASLSLSPTSEAKAQVRSIYTIGETVEKALARREEKTGEDETRIAWTHVMVAR